MLHICVLFPARCNLQDSQHVDVAALAKEFNFELADLTNRILCVSGRRSTPAAPGGLLCCAGHRAG
jgi:hypothetical protein